MPLNRLLEAITESTSLYKPPTSLAADSTNVCMLSTGFSVVKTESTNLQNLASSFTAVKIYSTNLYKHSYTTANKLFLY